MTATRPMGGTYDAATADGKTKMHVVIAADGGYKATTNGGLPVAGIVKMVGTKTCFDPSGPKPAVCYTDSPVAADGSFTTTADDGTAMMVKKVM